jgi:peptide/nickel transport system permease protein
MWRFVVRRLFQAIPVLIGVTVVVFLLIQLVPGDPAATLLWPEATPAEVQELRRVLGLDRPLLIQYFRWLGGVLRGDFGTSIEFRRPVAELIWARLQNTLILAGAALTVSTVLGILIGILSAVKPRSAIDRAGMFIALLGNSMPAFWIGILLLLVFALRLRWFPVGGMYSLRGDGGLLDLLHHLVLPAITLGMLAVATIARMTRSCMLDVIKQDYVRTATAKGVHYWRVIIRHAFRNALLPIVTVIGLQLGYMLGGAVLTETVFSWPGVGLQLFRAISTRDLPLIQGGILLIAVGFVMINLLVDILYAYLDPRTAVRSRG